MRDRRYITDIPHQQICAVDTISTLYRHGIAMPLIPVSKDTYHSFYPTPSPLPPPVPPAAGIPVGAIAAAALYAVAFLLCRFSSVKRRARDCRARAQRTSSLARSRTRIMVS